MAFLLTGQSQDVILDAGQGRFIDSSTITWVSDTNANTMTANAAKDSAIWNADRLQGISISSTAPTDGQALVYSNANARWEPGNVSTSPGGSDTQVQFNDAGSFGGSTQFTFDKLSNILSLGDKTAAQFLVGNGDGNSTTGTAVPCPIQLAVNPGFNSAFIGFKDVSGGSGSYGWYQLASNPFGSMSLLSRGGGETFRFETQTTSAFRLLLNSNILWDPDGSGDIGSADGGATFNRPNNIFTKTKIQIGDGGNRLELRSDLVKIFFGSAGKIETPSSLSLNATNGIAIKDQTGTNLYYDLATTFFALRNNQSFHINSNLDPNPYDAGYNLLLNHGSGTSFLRTTGATTIDLHSVNFGTPLVRPKLARFRATAFGYNEQSSNADLDSFEIEISVLVKVDTSGTPSIISGSKREITRFESVVATGVALDVVVSGTNLIVRGTGVTGVDLIWYSTVVIVEGSSPKV